MSVRRILPVAYAALLAAGYALVFVVPWHVPVAPAESDAYAIGFSNRASLIGVIATGVALFALGWVARRPSAKPLVRTEAPPRAERVSGWLVAGLLAVSLATALFIAWIGLHTPLYGEKYYFLDRTSYAIGGMTPYRDFEFTYGPLLALLPALVWRLVAPLGISIEGAYAGVYVMIVLAGVPLLAWTVDRLELTRAGRNATFAALGLYTVVNETDGLQGVLARFVLPAAALLLFHARAQAALRRRGGPAAVRIWAWAALVVMGAVAVSPDAGIACLVGVTAYLAWVATADRRLEPLVALAGVAATTGVVATIVGTGIFSHLIGMAGGALNLPVVPSPPVLLLLTAALGGAALLPRFLVRESAGAPALFALAAATAVMLAGALGRTDTTHVYFYGLTAALFAAPMFAALDRRVFATWAVAFAAVFAFAHLLTIHYDYGGKIALAVANTPGVSRSAEDMVSRTLGVSVKPGRTAWDAAQHRADPYDVAVFAPYAPLAAPRPFLDDLGMQLAMRGWLASAYFIVGPYTADELRLQEEWLSRSRYIVLNRNLGNSLSTPPPAPRQTLGGDREYGAALMWPQSFPRRNPATGLGAKQRAYLAAHYRKVRDVWRYTILERTGP